MMVIQELLELMREAYPEHLHQKVALLLRLDGSCAIYKKDTEIDVLGSFQTVEELTGFLQNWIKSVKQASSEVRSAYRRKNAG